MSSSDFNELELSTEASWALSVVLMPRQIESN